MNGESLNIQKDSLDKLQQLFPELFSESQLDWEKLKSTFSNDINFANERYVLNWACKADAFTLDNLFTGNDQLKTNTVLQMKDAGIDFKTI